MDTEQGRDAAYVLGHTEQELERLMTQSQLFEPFTAQLFRDAGIAPGMRVLDVGSGSGDVSFLAARMVGPSGHVVGVDRSAVALFRSCCDRSAYSVRCEGGRDRDVAMRQGCCGLCLFSVGAPLLLQMIG